MHPLAITEPPNPQTIPWLTNAHFQLELTCVSGNMDLNGFETVIYPYSVNVYDVNELNIYIDNSNGNDENDGLTQEKSLKTIEKALEIIKNNSKIEIATLNIVS